MNEFKTSSACTLSFGFCVGVRTGETVDVIDTKDPNGPVLSFTKDEWDAFVQGVKNGEFDV